MIGLFHDAGIPAMAMNYDDYINVLAESNRDYHDYLKQIDEGADQLTFSALKTAKNLVHVNKRFIASPDWPYIKMKYWTH